MITEFRFTTNIHGSTITTDGLTVTEDNYMITKVGLTKDLLRQSQRLETYLKQQNHSVVEWLYSLFTLQAQKTLLR